MLSFISIEKKKIHYFISFCLEKSKALLIPSSASDCGASIQAPRLKPNTLLTSLTPHFSEILLCNSPQSKTCSPGFALGVHRLSSMSDNCADLFVSHRFVLLLSDITELCCYGWFFYAFSCFVVFLYFYLLCAWTFWPLTVQLFRTYHDVLELNIKGALLLYNRTYCSFSSQFNRTMIFKRL